MQNIRRQIIDTYFSDYTYNDVFISGYRFSRYSPAWRVDSIHNDFMYYWHENAIDTLQSLIIPYIVNLCELYIYHTEPTKKGNISKSETKIINSLLDNALSLQHDDYTLKHYERHANNVIDIFDNKLYDHEHMTTQFATLISVLVSFRKQSV